ncbi:MAG: 50S ribosomal protein L11 methyltransferase [Deltaproteobacteria bacterium]|nr:50S ribosomal protein L11 methyltransferase [Deltaproteobacteria bacterium]MBI3390366.1 50S ribosomal protein L11 methyltransferase [Deltaproteobacteria bacterium]
MPTAWTETTVAVASPHAESVASFLLDLGSPGLVSDEAESAGEPQVTLTAYLALEATDQLAALRAFCDQLAIMDPALPPARIATRVLQREDWAHNWMEHFPPLTIGERLSVIPPWISDVPAGRIAIVIDPGLAFGTGHHATTQGCLELIEQHASGRSLECALDVGTGSGILAIALAKFGVAHVAAVDIDPEACRAACENCARNSVSHSVSVSEHLPAAGERFDVIVANLLSSLLIDLAPNLRARLAPTAHLIASGILLSEAEAVRAAFAAVGLVEHDRTSTGEWVTLDLAAIS